MGKGHAQETSQRRRRQLGVEADVAAKALVDILCTLCELLAESVCREVPEPRPVETDRVAELLSSEQAAAYLGVTKSTLATWRCTGRYAIPFVKVGRKVRYRKADLDRFFEQRTATNSGEAGLL
jgi:excisionase family DNA binding protein